jgi:hypothetical protein
MAELRLLLHAMGQTSGFPAFTDQRRRRAVPGPGSAHYLGESSPPSYDTGATELLTSRVLEFLRARDRPGPE